jgi:23S rRNA (adenine2030-N6)-methyltransferase
MLSYRHGYHAGSPADVLKHAVFVQALRHAMAKPAPLYVLDTHAGAGTYALDTAMAEKLGEWRTGILEVLRARDPPALVAPLLELVAAANPARQLLRYPGSAGLAAALLRPGDRLELVELHPTDRAALERTFAGRPEIRVSGEDGLAALVARMPPAPRRGVVLLDPSYEIKDEFAAVPRALLRAHRRFGTGTFMLWYPVIARARTDELLAHLARSGVRRQFRIELCQRPDGVGRGMTGAGLVVVNPPWTLPSMAADALPWLAAALHATGPARAEWLVPE